MVPYLMQGENVVVYVNNAPVIVNKSHMNYAKLIQALKAKDWPMVEKLSSVRNAAAAFSEGRVSITGETVFFDGKEIHNALTARLYRMFAEGFDISHFCKFMERLDANPSYRARTELYGFLEACELPITDDGCFLAYKKIRSDWTDVHTGTMSNALGTVVEMPRRDVNENPNETCSAGLHVCSYSYLKSFPGDRVIAVKVDPADVVAVPIDYNNAKMRTCKYVVLQELEPVAAQESDTLSARGAVVGSDGVSPARTCTSTPVKKTTSYKVEDVLFEMSEMDFDLLCVELGANPDDYSEQDELGDDYRFSVIRAAIDKLGLM